MATEKMQGKPCQWHDGCQYPAVPGERFCRGHRVAMIRKMEDEGYLQPKPEKRIKRPPSHREDTDATKFGMDQ